MLHNFVWHECWTWRDRTAVDGAGLWGRLLRFNLASGTVSVVGNVVFTGLFARLFGMHYVVANMLAIATCSVLNFLAADRFAFVARHRGCACRAGAVVVSTALGLVAMLSLPVDAAELRPRTVAARSASSRRESTEAGCRRVVLPSLSTHSAD